MKNFDDLFSHLQSSGVCRRTAVVLPHDESTLAAVARGREAGFIDPIFIDEPTPQAAAERAVELIQRGEADLLMKGLVSSDILLRAVLRHEGGLLQPGQVLTHLACAQIAGIDRLLLYTDVAVLPFPTHEQRLAQVALIAQMARRLGCTEPRIALIHCSEHVDGRHFPYTEGYRDIVAMAQEGHFGPAIVDGPLDLKTALDAESLRIKGISSPLEGRADALIFPDIEAGNVFHKTITLLGQARVGCLLAGARVPIIMPSRADDADSKYLGLLLAASQGQ